MTEHARWEELAAGHAFDALEPEDEQEFLAHLRGCDLCVRSLAEMRALGAELAYAAEPAEPPDRLWERIRGSLQVSERPSVFAEPTPARTPVRRRRPLQMLAAAAALTALVATSALVVGLRADNRTKALALARAAAVLALENDPATKRVALTSVDGAKATVLSKGATAYLLVDGLAENDAQSVYVLWGIDATARPSALSTFDVVHSGVNVIGALPLPANLAGLTGLAISREPGRRAPSAPTTVVANGSIA